jgi:hypothetical protein
MIYTKMLSSATKMPREKFITKIKRVALGALSLLIASALWLPAMQLFHRPDLDDYRLPDGPPPELTQQLIARQLHLWADPELRQQEVEKMRGSNAEWDFMGRSYLVWALANIALRDPEVKDECLDVIDRIIDETLRLETEHGHFFFLMDYAQESAFEQQPARSLFIDGEIALMLGVRRLVEEKDEYREPFAERVRLIHQLMKEGPVLSAESYPYECWLFCNTVALAAMKTSDVLDGSDHSAFFTQWVAVAKEKLIHEETGLLISCYTPEGGLLHGPEGSSIWMASHCLMLIDEEFAHDQYRRARKELGRELLGFGFAREWPPVWPGGADVDSGPIIPLLEASPGSSGLALLGAASFGDDEYLTSLLASLSFAGFPVERDGELQFCASNQVGDAVMLYALVCGPLWEKVRELEK